MTAFDIPAPFDSSDPDAALRVRLNRETARLRWHEVLPQFAAGNVVAIDVTLDLIDVAAKLAQDDTATVSTWMAHGLLRKVTDAQAAQWVGADPLLWAVVVKPWILVQLDLRRAAPARPDA